MKKYRNSDCTYITTSILIEEKILEKIEKKIQDTNHYNLSCFIEQICRDNVPHKVFPARRKKPNQKLIKKTLTFSEPFFNKIKNTGNMTLCVEEIISNKL